MTKADMAKALAKRRFPVQGETIRNREYARLMRMSKLQLTIKFERVTWGS